MIKTVKGKVIAGTVAVTLFAGSGVAFGASDAGIKIKAWYDVQFGKTSANVETNYQAYQKDKLDGFATEVKDLKENATKKIDEGAAKQIADKSKNINDQKNEHIDAIKGEKAKIEGYMDSQFKTLSDAAKNKINSAADEALNSAEAEMLKHTNTEGAEALAFVQKEIKASTASAVDELKKAIADAKLDLQIELESKSTATVNELKGVIDTKINILIKNINLTTTKLVAGHNRIIMGQAEGLEQIAKKEMKDLVDGI
ncbi:hypothetical protein [Bacillus sp. FJAT-22090]|uniref:hypothetical protein n=1 Tax=Bacillus sp. FJAT-22090 TaxID=1581038 RepID=UPI0011A681E4|nr:hypothetical protein [Bacillus sp. FJAT-22090]